MPDDTILFSGSTVLCSSPDGVIAGGRHGLYHRDARILACHRLTLDGRPLELVHIAQVESDRSTTLLRRERDGGTPDGPLLPEDSVELILEREVGPGLVERLHVHNRSRVPCRTSLRLDLDADFIDVAELDRDREQQGEIRRRATDDMLEFEYRVQRDGRVDERGLRIRVDTATSAPRVDEHGVSFDLDLPEHGHWEASLTYAVREGAAWRERTPDEAARRDRQRRAWRARRTFVEADDRLVRIWDRAADDLFDLRNLELEEQLLGSSSGAAWLLNAGVPTYTGFFGRDTAIVGWQSLSLGPRAAVGGLAATARTQSDTDSAWRDAEPGKLIHEMRTGPLAELGVVPQDAYYGSQTTAALFVVVLAELWHWTGNDDLLREHLDTARGALAWAREHGDLDGDGFLEYERRSPRGLPNQAWKDSDEAIRHANGRSALGPIATVEEQAYHVLAIERMAEILTALGDDAAAATELRRARDLRRRWHDAFWMPDMSYYAMALDGDKRQVQPIASNAGHALAAGVVPRPFARAVADRLLAPDLFSGWGIRTLSSEDTSYNPFAYHLGAVWPVEQMPIALGLKRYGFERHLDRLADGVLRAAELSPGRRLPEALTGHDRREVPAPVPYPRANSPQAWSASAVIGLVQTMLGLEPFAPLRMLRVVRPRLPAWLPGVTIRGLRVGRAVVDIRYDRRADGSAAWRVVRRRGPLLVVPAAATRAPGSLRPSERAVAAALQHAPGRLARAARIAFGDD